MNHSSRNTFLLLAALLIAVGAAFTQAHAAAPIYMKFDGVDGEAKARLQRVECQTISLGIVSPIDHASGQATGKRQHKPFIITKELDKSTPLLAKYAADGKHFPTVELSFPNPKGGPNAYYKVTFEDVVISSITKPNNAQPMESISFNFTKILFENREISSEQLMKKTFVVPHVFESR